MLPVLTIVGRPNVGKSTLFNVLTHSRDALVADMPGVTRDRQYGDGKVGDRPYLVVDTGGIVEAEDPNMGHLTEQQVNQALSESDQILFMVDAKVGLTAADEVIARQLRDVADKVVLVVNKVDREQSELAVSDFYQLGFANVYAIAATTKRGVAEMMDVVLQAFPETDTETEEVAEQGIAIAVIGRPNVGKSTLVNRMLGEDRVVVFDHPGTTRDSIRIPFERRGKHYTLIDTAGIRRRTKITEAVEKFSIIKSMQAIKEAHVVIVVVNAQEGLTEQDLRLIGFVIEMGKGLVVAINKWDGLDEYDRDQIKQAVDRRLTFVSFARRYFISALHGTGVGKLYDAIHEAYHSANQSFTTSEVTQHLMKAVSEHQPPLVRGRRIRLRYAHIGGHHPLTVVVHGKQTTSLPQSYKRYLAGYFRKAFNLMGVPLLLEFKNDHNPYQP